MADIRRNGKQYGLINPKKTPLSAPKAINVFGNEDESEDEDGTDWVKRALKAEGEKNRVKRQMRLNIEKALCEDPTICQYDEVFDDMKHKEAQGKSKKKEVKKAKYIDNLLKTAERRKREQEHRIERMVQKEREAEGAMFADKESFVTSAYRAKLEEFKKMEEEEQNMDRLESIGDVTKQQDMSGFYRHFFEQTVAGEKSGVTDSSNTTNKRLKAIDDDNTRKSKEKVNPDADDELPSTSASEASDDDSDTKTSKVSKKIDGNKKQQIRQYRRRVIEASESESDREESKNAGIPEPTKEGNPVEQISAREEETEPVSKKIKKTEEEIQCSKDDDKFSKNKSRDDLTSARKDDSRSDTPKLSEKIESTKSVKEEEKNKVSIWEKRTVETVFEAALQRYYERKAMRLSGS